MHRFGFMCLCVVMSMGAVGQTYHPVDHKSTVSFAIKNFAVNVGGSFAGLKGTIQFNPAELNNASIRLSADAATVHTGIAARDKHLQKEEYFDVEKYPLLSFSSKKIVSAGKPGDYEITGTITIKGTSKEISFPFTAKPQDGGILFTCGFKLNRRDFKVGGSSMVMSDNLNVSVTVFGEK